VIDIIGKVECGMPNPVLGLIAGVIFGAIAVGTMVPLSFPDKRAALLGAFSDRFAIGLVIGCVQLPWPGWALGLFFGLLLCLPSAIVTKAYPPVLLLGGVGGLVIGGLIHGWGFANGGLHGAHEQLVRIL
jgi:hypothetical protein